MEHYALMEFAPIAPVVAGTRVIVVRARESGAAWTADFEVLAVLGIQPTVVRHYSRDEPAPVQPTPSLMERHGWQFHRLEYRYAPIYCTADGRLATADPDDPRWSLVHPGTPDDRIRVLAEKLKVLEVERRQNERRVEEEEEVEREVEED